MLTRMLPVPLLTLALATLASADEFDRLEGRTLAEIPGSDMATAHESISIQDLVLLPNVLRDSRAALVIVKTDQGNPARLLVTPAFRKAPDGQGEPSPILLLERFDTFEAGPATSILAGGRDRVLFDGFRLDLDTGQVVPDGQGGDIQFQGGEKPAQQKLIAIGGAKLFTLAKSPLSDQAAPDQPSPGRNVIPGDFAGRYRLVANGQWTGTLTLKVGDDGALDGQFRSDQTGSSYRVTGQAGGESANQLRFEVVFPRSRQEYEGRLFTNGKGAIAGSTTLLDRTYGFFALRMGGTVAPPGIAIVKAPRESAVVQVPPEGPYLFGGKMVDEEELLPTLKAAFGNNPMSPVILQAAPETPYHRVSELLDRLREGGITDVRLGVSD